MDARHLSANTNQTLLKIFILVVRVEINRFKNSHTAAYVSFELQIIWFSFLCVVYICGRRSAG